MSQTRLLEVARGVVLLACFRRAGFAHLGGSSQDVLSSLAPLLALLIVSTVLDAMGGAGPHLLGWLLAALSVLLLPLVMSEALARFWGRGAAWGRYMAAFNWCQWAVTFAAIGALVAANVLAILGLPRGVAAALALLAVVAYHLALQWFLARHGLDISAGRAALLVAAVEVLTSGLVVLFLLLDGALTDSG